MNEDILIFYVYVFTNTMTKQNKSSLKVLQLKLDMGCLHERKDLCKNLSVKERG